MSDNRFENKNDYIKYSYVTKCVQGEQIIYKFKTDCAMKKAIPILCEKLYYFENVCSEHNIKTEEELEQILNNNLDMRTQMYNEIRKKVLNDINCEINSKIKGAVSTYFTDIEKEYLNDKS